MKMQAKLISVVGAAVIACSLGVAVAQSKKEPVFVESEKAEFKEVIPGIKKKILWGNDDVGPYGAFTKFDPGITNPLHTHTNEVRIVVLRAPTFTSRRTARRGGSVPAPTSPFRAATYT